MRYNLAEIPTLLTLPLLFIWVMLYFVITFWNTLHYRGHKAPNPTSSGGHGIKENTEQSLFLVFLQHYKGIFGKLTSGSVTEDPLHRAAIRADWFMNQWAVRVFFFSSVFFLLFIRRERVSFFFAFPGCQQYATFQLNIVHYKIYIQIITAPDNLASTFLFEERLLLRYFSK